MASQSCSDRPPASVPIRRAIARGFGAEERPVHAQGVRGREAMSRIVRGFEEPLCYRHHSEWGSLLRGLGFHVRVVRVPDVLPYPHVVIAATKKD